VKCPVFGKRLAGFVLVAASIAGCSGESAAPATTRVLDFTLVTATTSTVLASTTSTLAVDTTKPGSQWPADAPFVDLYEDDEIKRTEQFNAYFDWQNADSRRREANYSLYVEPGSIAEAEARGTVDLNKDDILLFVCPLKVDSVIRWKVESDRLIWMQSTGSLPGCTGTNNGEPIAQPARPLIVRYMLWARQNDGRWLVREYSAETSVREL
jgi:hypothetical protein